ncbi:MAG: hypothetical protein PVF28_01800 [Thioalkalispiraceae bacterium]|jgi:hypothetical protein
MSRSRHPAAGYDYVTTLIAPPALLTGIHNQILYNLHMSDKNENNWADARLGVSSEDIMLETSNDNQQLAVQLVSQASHRLDVFTRDLDPRIFDSTEFVDAVRTLALKDNRAKIRFLVIDPDKAIKLGHRLLELSRRLTSRFELRKVHEDYSANPESYLIVDERGLLHRKLASRYEGVANFNNPLAASGLMHHFNEVWEHSTPVLDFKRLYI